MNVYTTDDIRNVVLVGHGSVGKTTFAEAALFASGAITRMGTVEEQNTVGDYDDDEHKRKFSLNVSILPVEWRESKVNLIDTPGYADFISEVICGAHAADLAMVVVDAVSGPEVGTDRAWNVASELSLPKMLLINRMDRENASFEQTLAALQAKWGSGVTALFLPIGSQQDFVGIVDLLSMRAYMGPEGTEEAVPDSMLSEAEDYRGKLVETIVETDEGLMNKYFADEELSEEELSAALKAGLISGSIVPVVCSAAAKQIGVRPVLDTLLSRCPSPAQVAPLEVDGSELAADPSGPTVVRVFKTSADPYVGKLTYLRLISGKVTSDSHLWNSNESADERLGTLYLARGKEQEPIVEMSAGDIGVVTKLAQTSTGNTLATKGNPVVVPPIEFPQPVFSMALQPASKATVDKLVPSLQRLVEEDPGLRLTRDQSSGETILSGLGDAHIDVTIERLKRKFNVDVELSLPRVAYLETVSRKSSADYTHKKQTGGHGQYGRVSIEIGPLPRGTGVQFSERVVGGSVPREFIPAVEKGVMETSKEGVVAGYNLTDCEVILFDGKHHPVDSSEMSFKLAASQALREAVQDAGPVILEPVMKIQVIAPEEHSGDVVSDLNTKRAKIQGITPDGNVSVIEAEVPLAEVQRYASDLRSVTQGRGGFTMEFEHYAELPSQLAQKVTTDAKVAAKSRSSS
ncbi:MAG TPA: elongation factor G [Dehalococcoidia bacterium]|nr:elongation factor G [Dehalococcoidia bacterium]